jgi:hypothetical protein
MILNSLGEEFSNEFKACGHQAVSSAQGGKDILNDLNSGDSTKVRDGLHQLSGHARKQIVDTLPDQMVALKGVAIGVARGDFQIETHGNLLAASQFQAAKLGKDAGRPCNPESVLAVYAEAISSPRSKRRPDFKAWLAGTSVAGLRESSAPAEAVRLLKAILGDKKLFSELDHKAPSQLREVLLVAAPKLCMPVLFDCYELSLRYGSARERGLALHNISILPEVISQLGPNHPSRAQLLAQSQRFAQALQIVIDEPGAVVVDVRDSKKTITTQELSRVLQTLRQAPR